MTRPSSRGTVRRFVVLGGINTVATFLLFTGLQHVTTVGIAYTLAFAAGLVFATGLAARVVFRARTTYRRRLTYACCYLVIYGAGFAVSHALHRHAAPWLVSAGTIAITAPLGYLAGRTVLVPPEPGTRRSP